MLVGQEGATDVKALKRLCGRTGWIGLQGPGSHSGPTPGIATLLLACCVAGLEHRCLSS